MDKCEIRKKNVAINGEKSVAENFSKTRTDKLKMQVYRYLLCKRDNNYHFWKILYRQAILPLHKIVKINKRINYVKTTVVPVVANEFLKYHDCINVKGIRIQFTKYLTFIHGNENIFLTIIQ